MILEVKKDMCKEENQVIELKKEIEELNRRISSIEVDIFYEKEYEEDI